MRLNSMATVVNFSPHNRNRICPAGTYLIYGYKFRPAVAA